MVYKMEGRIEESLQDALKAKSLGFEVNDEYIKSLQELSKI